MKLILAVIGLASCAFAGNAPAVASSCGPDGARFDVTKHDRATPVANSDAAKALVYVISDGPVRTTRIGLDGAWVRANHRNSWLSFLAEPGEHHLCADWQPSRVRILAPVSRARSVSLTHFTAEAGKVYYFRVRPEPRLWNAGSFFDLEPTNSDEGQLLIASSKFSTFRPKK